MLFNSYPFIFVFLPVVLVGFFQLARIGHSYAAAWLALASLFFYGYWNPIYVPLLLASIVGNYAFGRRLARSVDSDSVITRKGVLAIAVGANLALLGYFKYANFFVKSLDSVTGAHISIASIVLPLGISFFTFTQIAYLVDTYQQKVKESRFLHYLLFVTFFPHLIAGPVLHHKQMMPQFDQPGTYRWDWTRFGSGMAFFSMGLAKKVLVADSLAEYAMPVFGAASQGVDITFLSAWTGLMAYTLQIYFDFSGYSDMAIGIAKMIGVNLPLNFNSPYKATNIIEFWRRWHMTLSQFLRDYLYIPLGGNRHGGFRRYCNLGTTMLLGGLWHGANWTFVIWGGIHGAYLVVNHLWQYLTQNVSVSRRASRLGTIAGAVVTFFAVAVAWVFFRSASVSAAKGLLAGMLGLHGISLPRSMASLEENTRAFPFKVIYAGLTPELNLHEVSGATAFWFAISFTIIWALPNTQELIYGGERRAPWQGWLTAGATCGALFAASVLALNRISEFLYFQF